MKRYVLILFVLFCFSPTSHAQESEPPHTIALNREVEEMVWSPDSRYIAFLATDEDYDTNVQVIEVSTGQIIADFDYEPRVIAWSPDSTRLAVNAARDTDPNFGGGGTYTLLPVTILDIQNGDETGIGSDVNINGIAWSPDGTRLAVTTNRYETSDAYRSSVQIWDIAERSVITKLIDDDWASVNYYWYAPVWSPDGTRLAIPNASGSLAVWDVERQEEVFSVWGFPEYAHNVAWSPSGDLIAASGEDMIRIWDATTGEPLSAILGYAFELRWVNDDQLAVVESDHVSFIDPFSGRASGTLEARANLTACRYYWEPCITWSPNGQYVAHADDNEIHIFSPIYSPVESQSPPITLTLAHSIPPVLSTLPAATEPITTTNADQLTFMGQFGRDDIRDALWSPDGRTIALLGTQGVWLYDDPTLTQPPRLLEIANGTVSAMLFSPDSRYLVLALENETYRDFGIRFWDLQSNRIAKVLQGHIGTVTTMDFSADGHWLAAGSADLTVRLWNVDTSELIHTLWGHVDRVLSVDFNPDASILVSAGDSMIRLWDVESGEWIDGGNGDWSYVRQDPSVVNARFTPDGKAVFYFYLDLNGERVSLRRWSLSSETHWDLGISPFSGISGFVGNARRYEMAFSPDGIRMIPYTLYGSPLSILDVNTGEEIKQWWALSCVFTSGTVAFSPDGLTLAAGINGSHQACGPYTYSEPKTIWLWDMQTGERQTVLRGQVAPVERLLFSPDSSRLLAVSTDNTLRLWDVATGEELRVLTDYSNPASHLMFDATGALVSLEMARDAVVVRVDGQPVRGVGGRISPAGAINPPVTSVRPSQDFSLLIMGQWSFSIIFSAGSESITVWNSETDEYLLELSQEMSYRVQSAAANPSGTLLASSEDGVVRLWDVSTQTERTVLWDNPTLGVRGLAFSPDGRSLAGVISRLGNVVKFWELTTGTQRSIVLPDSDAYITELTFSPDNCYIAAQTGESDVWILTLQTNRTPIVFHPGAKRIYDITFSQDSALIALATGDEIQLWDRATGGQLVSLAASSVSVAFNNDDTLLASGESDGTIRLWGLQ